MQLSIIVPVLNEASRIPELLASLEPYRLRGHEVIFVDGGSDDQSFALIANLGGRVIRSPRGRAKQMNTCAAKARGDVLLFLHADTQLPPDADRLIAERMAAQLTSVDRCWGRFDVRIAGRSRWFPLVAFMINWRSRLTGIATGDQAIFVSQAAFKAVGGFPDQPLMEDIEISKRLKHRCAPICVRAPVLTSGRRWEQHGVWRTIVLMWRLRWAYWRGAPAADLARLYR